MNAEERRRFGAYFMAFKGKKKKRNISRDVDMANLISYAKEKNIDYKDLTKEEIKELTRPSETINPDAYSVYVFSCINV
jgi:hypothetical protein